MPPEQQRDPAKLRAFGGGSSGLRLDFRAVPIRNSLPELRISAKSSARKEASWKTRRVPQKSSRRNTAARRKLPEVAVVKAFVLRRQFYRIFSIPNAIKPIVESLKQLKEFMYEPIRQADEIFLDDFWKRMSEQHDLFSNAFLARKETLTKVCFFDGCYGDWEDWYVLRATINRPGPGFRDEEVEKVSVSLALRSRTLEELHASPTVEAKHFFYQVPSGDEHLQEDDLILSFDEWPRLKYLSLTAYPQSQQDCSHLLQSAATATRRMPQLQVMELRSSRLRAAFIFRYERKSERGLPKIVLQTSWNGKLDETVIEAWNKVAQGHTEFFRELECECSGIGLRNGEFSKWQIVKLLALKGRMLNQTTLKQMEEEAEGR